MEEKRIAVFGEDAEGKSKRGFDVVLIDGKTYLESINRQGHRVKTPVDTAISAVMQLHEPGAKYAG